ncbi:MULTISPECIES: flagellar hook-length control protein FliK [Pseudomonas]|uniref:Flagellar hook-length control protein FliK n=4 Tax=Pseudomonas TaxID=286 RepID=A0A267CSB6_PSEFR|nr:MULTISPECIES: flagellar hook-length control protein FliK [Pseudomonas]MDY7569216.1 flagellar hook-length control protein FliK [Pseudomonas sp. CCC4.1]MEB0145602.1 flagellar hook-length control protein FliK [Pseudomonas sp. CCC4.1]MQT86362.1 flagellar hook-length control protein FliK [Pseudomonas sp. FSL R10-2964]OZY63340.1 flagellar hook-length control protein FliK [Pseudomonas fragi]PAA34216.1 flagellar hook-length control protein FliK [Pseudomonas fragi]
MPVAAQTLLLTPAAAAPKASASSPVQPAKADAQPFAKVYAQAADPAPAVAGSGNPLPAGKTEDAVSTDQDDSTDKPGDDVATADPLATQPVVPVPVPAVEAAPPAQPATPEVQVAQLAAQAPPPLAADDDTFDPQADPLDAMPAVRLAMEQGGHVSASSQSPVKTPSSDAAPAAAQGQASGIAMLVDDKSDDSTTGEGGEKSFKGLVDEGLKDLKSASSDTRVDDFANRLAALTQAAVPKTTNALPVNQPLAMHQSGWSEEVVNRVMYLSSANLKSADIQLEPAELGRLDIRVNIAADQSAQVNFVSGHAGVREALDSQMHRLREMLAQQGMGQVDVNVSDQQRNWQGQQGQEQQARSGGGGQRLDSLVDDEPVEVAAVAPSVVLGSSAVDYYA